MARKGRLAPNRVDRVRIKGVARPGLLYVDGIPLPGVEVTSRGARHALIVRVSTSSNAERKAFETELKDLALVVERDESNRPIPLEGGILDSGLWAGTSTYLVSGPERALDRLKLFPGLINWTYPTTIHFPGEFTPAIGSGPGKVHSTPARERLDHHDTDWLGGARDQRAKKDIDRILSASAEQYRSMTTSLSTYLVLDGGITLTPNDVGNGAIVQADGEYTFTTFAF